MTDVTPPNESPVDSPLDMPSLKGGKEKLGPLQKFINLLPDKQKVTLENSQDLSGNLNDVAMGLHDLSSSRHYPMALHALKSYLKTTSSVESLLKDALNQSLKATDPLPWSHLVSILVQLYAPSNDASLQSFVNKTFSKGPESPMIDRLAEIVKACPDSTNQIPALDKLILRQPDVACKIIQHIPADFSTLITPLLNCLKNSNPAVRQDAIKAIQTLSPSSTPAISDVVTKAINAKIPNNDHRLSTWQALLSLNPASSTLDLCIAQATKEPLESIVQTIVDTMFKNSIVDEAKFQKYLVTTLADAKTPLTLRKHLVQHLTSSKGLEKSISSLVTKFSSLGITAIAQEGKQVSVGETFAALALLPLDELKKIVKDDKSFVYNDKIFSKATGSDYQALQNAVIRILSEPSLHHLIDISTFCNLVNYIAINQDSPVRRSTRDKLAGLAPTNPILFAQLAANCIQSTPVPPQESLAWGPDLVLTDSSISSRLWKLVNACFVKGNSSAWMKLLVPMHQPIMKQSWQSLDKDAKSAITSHPEVIKEILDSITPSIPALLTLLRICPSMVSRVIPEIISNLSSDVQVSLKDYKIYSTPPGTLAFEIATKDQGKPRTKDEKWEAEVKKKLGQVTKEQEGLIQKQLAAEAIIREQVSTILEPYLFQLSLLDQVLGAVEEGDLELDNVNPMAPYIQPLTTLLLDIITRETTENVPKIATSHAIPPFITLGNVAGWQIASTMNPPILPIATLMNLEIPFASNTSPGIPIGWKGSDKSQLTMETLSRLVNTQLSPESFAYLTPFLSTIISNKNPQQIEQLVQLLSNQLVSHDFASSAVYSQAKLLQMLFDILANYPKFSQQVKDTIVNQSQGISSPEAINLILEHLVHSEPSVREAACGALRHIQTQEIKSHVDPLLWMSRHDGIVSPIALQVWGIKNGEDTLDSSLIPALLQLTMHEVPDIRLAAATSLAQLDVNVSDIIQLYLDCLKPPPPEYDEYGVEIKQKPKPDPHHRRLGLALALKHTSPNTSPSDWKTLVEFYINQEALGDKNEQVRVEMREALLSLITSHQTKLVETLLPKFDTYLSSPGKASHDRIRESVVLALGTLSQYLDPKDSHVQQVVSQLVETLKTPSESVQMAVADCLPALVKNMDPEESKKLILSLLDTLYSSPDYAQRRGAAFGLAGAIKGRGVGSIKEFSIIQTLTNHIQDKKASWQEKEASLLAFETLALTLGRLFEPYVVQVLPVIVPCFGDGKSEVREATWDTSKAIMGKISAHGVKLLLPSLLKGLEDSNWRSKVGSIELLGSMAFLAPKQLTTSLPVIVPRLCDVLTDSHSKVQESARSALVHFGEVIKNPEVSSLVPILLAALVDPNTKTLPALNALLETAFVHYIDAPSLALIIPIVRRGLRERGTDTKKRAAQIMGSMATLTNPQDLTPYIRELLPELHAVLVDPVPEARAVAAKALGLIVQKLGEDNFSDVIPNLLDELNSDTAGVDRFGAAQGLAEVLSGLGLSRLESLLPTIVQNTKSPKAFVRESFLTLLVYLPATFRERYVPYLPQVIPPVLQGLADEAEAVRDASLKAGQIVVRNYSSSAIDLLLPSLEQGILDDSWRIRQSSVILLGDLMFRIIGITGKTSLEEEEGQGSEQGRKILIDTLGKKKYDQVLSRIYIVRNDVNALVRQSATHVWKSVVSNTPRTLKEIMPTLMDIVIDNLASESEEKSSVASRTLADLVRKMGESVLLEILPIFEKGLKSEDAIHRQGVCQGMREVLYSAGKSTIQMAADRLSPLVRQALLDPEPSVREAAAGAFNLLHNHVGGQAVDDVIPGLLSQLKANQTSEDSALVLEALKEILAVRAQSIIPQLLPTLLERPITGFRARALGALVTVASSNLGKRLGQVVPALLEAMQHEDLDEPLQSLMTSLDEDSLAHLHQVLVENISPGEALEKRVASCKVLALLFESGIDYSMYISDWLLTLIPLLASSEQSLVEASWKALDSLSKNVPKDEQDRYVRDVRRGMTRMVERWKKQGQTDPIPGLSLPKALSPMLSFYLQGLMYSSAETREQAAQGLAEMVNLTEPEILKPFVTQLAGALIRVSGERLSPEVKTALLQALNALLTRVPQNLKPFLPQLQRTFTKTMSDASPLVRQQTGACLTTLAPMMPKLDSLMTELLAAMKPTGDANVDRGIKISVYDTLSKLNLKSLSEAGKKSLENAILEGLNSSGDQVDDPVRLSASKAMENYLTIVENPTQVYEKLLKDPTGDYSQLHSLASILTIKGNWEDLQDKMMSVVVQLAKSDKPSIASVALQAASQFPWVTDDLMEAIAINLSDNRPSELRQEACRTLGILASGQDLPLPRANLLFPAVLSLTKDKTTPVKMAAEKCLAQMVGLTDPIDQSKLESKLSTVDKSQARSISEYVKRMSVKVLDN